MILLYTGIVLAGFYLFYITSKKAAVASLPLRAWAKNNARLSKGLGSFLVLGASVGYVMETGFGAGFFYALVALMAVASLVIILFPLFRNFTKPT